MIEQIPLSDPTAGPDAGLWFTLSLANAGPVGSTLGAAAHFKRPAESRGG